MPKKGTFHPYSVTYAWTESGLKGTKPYTSLDSAIYFAADMMERAARRESPIEVTIVQIDEADRTQRTVLAVLGEKAVAAVDRLLDLHPDDWPTDGGPRTPVEAVTTLVHDAMTAAGLPWQQMIGMEVRHAAPAPR